jgi:predicted MFS family arabinose efflux permease
MLLPIILLALGAFAIGTDANVVAGILPTIAHDQGLPVTTAGQFLVTVFGLSYAVAAPLLGALTSSWSRRRVLVTALALFSAASLLSAVAPVFGVLVATRILVAAIAALYSPTAAATAGALLPQRRGQALALIAAGLTGALVLGVPVGTWVADTFSWRMVFVLIAALGAVAIAGLLRALPEVAGSPAVSLRARFSTIRRPRVRPALLVPLLWAGGGFAVYTYISQLLQSTTHADSGALSGLLLLYGIGGVAGTWIGGYATDRWGAIRPLTIGLVASAGFLALLPLTASTGPGAGLTLLLWGVATWACVPAHQHRLIAMAPAQAGIILSFNASAVSLGTAAGAGLGGMLLKLTSFPTLTTAGAACLVLALGALLLSARPLKSAPRDPAREPVAVPITR